MLNIHRTRFAPRIFRNADKGGGTSGGNPTPQPASLTLEQQLTKARDDLAASQGQVTSLTSARDQLQSQVTALTTERDQIKGQFDSLTTTANDTKTKLTAAENQVTSLTTERDGFKSKLDTAQSNIARLESLCGVKGVDPNAVPPNLPEDSKGERLTMKQWEDRRNAAAPGAARSAVIAEFEKAVMEDRIAKF